MSDRDAISFFERALARNVEVKDRRRDARLYRALEDGHRRLVDEVCKRVTVSQMTTLSPGPASADTCVTSPTQSISIYDRLEICCGRRGYFWTQMFLINGTLNLLMLN